MKDIIVQHVIYLSNEYCEYWKSFIIVVLSFYYSKKKNNDGNDGAFNQVAPIMKRALPPTQKPIQAWTKWRFIDKQYTCIIRNKV